MRIEREFNTRIYKINKYYIELFIKLFKEKHNEIFSKIRKKLEKELKEEFPNLNISDNIIQLIRNGQIELNDFYNKFVEVFIRAIFKDSSSETREFLKLFELEPKTNIFDVKSLSALIKKTRGDFQKTLKIFDVVIEAFKKIQAVESEDEIQKILIKNLLYGRNVKKAQQNIKEYLLSFADENNKIMINERFCDIEDYAAMVARSRLREASSLGILEEAKKYDIYLFRFSIHNTRCKICKPFEGKIFSTKKNNKYPLLYKRPPLHPNCLHSIIPVYRD